MNSVSNNITRTEGVTFENFDYTAKPEDLFKVVEIFNDEYNSIIKKVEEAKNYIYDKEELQGIGRSYLDVVFTKWDDIVEQGYIDDDDLEIISDKIDQINDNYWDEPYNSTSGAGSVAAKYHELKHLKEKMIYFKRHLSLAEK